MIKKIGNLINSFLKTMFCGDLTLISNIPSWLISLSKPTYNSINDEVPWINYKAKKFLGNYLKKDMKVLTLLDEQQMQLYFQVYLKIQSEMCLIEEAIKNYLIKLWTMNGTQWE